MSYTIAEVERLPGGADDGSSEGVLRTRFDMAGLVPVAARTFTGALGDGISPSSSPSSGVAPQYPNTGVPSSMAITTVSQASETTSSLSMWQVRFYGRRIGAWLMPQFNVDPTMVAFVNAELVFAGKLGGVRLNGELVPSSRSLIDGYLPILLAQDLPDDGPHTLTLTAAPEQSVSASALVHALLLEERMGYVRDYRHHLQNAPVALTTTLATIASGVRGSLVAVNYFNVDTASRTVTISVGGQIFTQVIAAGASWTWLPGGGQPVIFQSTVQHKIDAITTSAVQAISILGQ